MRSLHVSELPPSSIYSFPKSRAAGLSHVQLKETVALSCHNFVNSLSKRFDITFDNAVTTPPQVCVYSVSVLLEKFRLNE